MNPQVWIAVVIGAAASIEDVLRHRISNWIPAAAFGAGLLYHVLGQGWQGALHALGGAACGLAVFLIFYLLGGMGGGDIKLMAGFGALLGAGRLLEAALWTAACGGLLAAGWIAVSAIRRKHAGLSNGAPANTVDSIPYAPAIAAGVWLSLVPKG
jgi:prepilin peptidase CpaA